MTKHCEDNTLSLVLLLFVLSSVGAQDEQVKGHVGGHVLLPCVYIDDLPEPVSSMWTGKNDTVVLDMVNNIADFRRTSDRFKGRVSIDHLQRRGNFSIVLENLTLSDSGVYDCYISDIYFRKTVQLIVTERKPGTEVEMSPPAVFKNSAVTLNPALLTLLISTYWFI